MKTEKSDDECQMMVANKREFDITVHKKTVKVFGWHK